jgi:CheY-like chemotaxis protein
LCRPSGRADYRPARDAVGLVSKGRYVVTGAPTAEEVRRLSAERRRCEALAIAAAHDWDVEVFVTDVVMPGMRGTELAARLRERSPRVRAVVADRARRSHG